VLEGIAAELVSFAADSFYPVVFLRDILFEGGY
jgi:hypothetical protein